MAVHSGKLGLLDALLRDLLVLLEQLTQYITHSWGTDQ